MTSGSAVGPFLKFFSIEYWKGLLDVSLGTEMLFVIFALVFVLVWGLSLGRTKTILSLLSVYVALAVAASFPFYDSVFSGKEALSEWIPLAVFTVSVVLVFMIFNASFLRKKLSSGEFNIVGVLMVTLLQVGLLAASMASFLPEELVRSKIGSLAPIFLGQAFFYWQVAPLLGILFINYFLKD